MNDSRPSAESRLSWRLASDSRARHAVAGAEAEPRPARTALIECAGARRVSPGAGRPRRRRRTPGDRPRAGSVRQTQLGPAVGRPAVDGHASFAAGLAPEAQQRFALPRAGRGSKRALHAWGHEL